MGFLANVKGANWSDRSGFDFYFTFCVNLGVLIVTTSENSAGKKSQLVKIWDAGKLSDLIIPSDSRSPLDPVDWTICNCVENVTNEYLLETNMA